MILIFSRLVVNFFLLTGLTKAGVVESGKGLITAGFRNKYFWQTSIVCTRNIIIDHFSVFNLVRQILKLSCLR